MEAEGGNGEGEAEMKKKKRRGDDCGGMCSEFNGIGVLSGEAELKARQKGGPCRDPGSNQGPLDLQSNALPTELPRRVVRPC